MITIYHNPRCSKSREGLLALEQTGEQINTVLYLENNLTYDQLADLIALLDIKPIELVRKQEQIWKENYRDLLLSDEQVIQAMVDHPKLIERPIVVYKDKAVIGRPVERIIQLVKK